MYKLRFVQKFERENQERFLEIEKKFIELEKQDSSMPKGKRYLPMMGKEPTNTLVWECEFEKLSDAMKALDSIELNETHTKLLNEQCCYMVETYNELYCTFDEE